MKQSASFCEVPTNAPPFDISSDKKGNLVTIYNMPKPHCLIRTNMQMRNAASQLRPARNTAPQTPSSLGVCCCRTPVAPVTLVIPAPHRPGAVPCGHQVVALPAGAVCVCPLRGARRPTRFFVARTASSSRAWSTLPSRAPATSARFCRSLPLPAHVNLRPAAAATPQ